MRYAAVLLVNLAALLPVWLGGWSVFAVLALFWFENLVAGIAQFFKLRRLEARRKDRESMPMSLFFAMHYGLFTLVHGVLVAVFFGIVLAAAREGGEGGWWMSALCVAAAYGLRFRQEAKLTSDWGDAGAGRLVAEPYGRMMALHLAVVGGAWFALESDQPQIVLLLLVGAKLLADLLLLRFWPEPGTPAARASVA